MSRLFDLELTGFENVLAQFNTLDDKVQKKALRPSLRAGAKIIQKAAKSKSPRLSGKNRKFIKIKSIKRTRKSIGLMIQTGTRQQLGIPLDEHGYYPMVLEYGSKNVRRQPFMKPALEQNRAKAIKAIGKELEKRIASIVRVRGRRT